MKPPLKIYVATSWKNDYYPQFVQALRGAGYDVFDFRAQNGFNWGEVDPNFRSWTADDYIKALSHSLPVAANEVDMEALQECDVCIALHECGKASHFELGYAVGRGKMGIVFLRDVFTVDVIYRNCSAVSEMDQLLEILKKESDDSASKSVPTERLDRWAAALRLTHWHEDDTLRLWDKFVAECSPPNGDGSEVELWRNVARAALNKLEEES